MSLHRSILLLLLLLATGCATARVVRLDTGRGASVVVSPPRADEPVELDPDAFASSLGTLAKDIRPSSYPLEKARRLFWTPARSAYSDVRGRIGVVSVGKKKDARKGPPPAAVELVRRYGSWCEGKSSPRDCLHLLAGTQTLGKDGKYTLAMAIAMDSVWDSTKVALGRMADPVAIEASIVTGMAMYMMLWVLPEPVSKGIAATLTACLIAYLGVSTTWELISGWIQLGISYVAVGQVQSIALTAEGFTIALAPGAVAMSAQGNGSGGKPPTGLSSVEIVQRVW